MSNINLELLNPNKNWTIGVGRNCQLQEIKTFNETVINSLNASRIEISNNLTINSGKILGPSELVIDPEPYDNIGGQVKICGDLIVEGITTTTTVNSSTVDILDNILTLNKGDENSFSQYSGVEIYLGNTNPKPQLLWNNNEISKRWELKYHNANNNDNSFNDLKIKNLHSQNIINNINLNVSGATTLQDLSAGATDISSTLNVRDATTLSSTLNVSGVTTLSTLFLNKIKSSNNNDETKDRHIIYDENGHFIIHNSENMSSFLRLGSFDNAPAVLSNDILRIVSYTNELQLWAYDTKIIILDKVDDQTKTNINSTLNVRDATTLQDLSAGATDISSTLNVSGKTNLQDLKAVDVSFTNLDISNDLYVNGNFYINDTELSSYLLESASNKIVSSNIFTNISRLVLTTNWVDCSDILFQEITPTTTNKKILVSIDFNYLCSVAYRERISIQILRFKSDNSQKILKENNYLGSLNGMGEFRGNYSCNFIDTPSSDSLVKYFVKFKLETNESQIPQGIININTGTDSGSSSISLIEF